MNAISRALSFSWAIAAVALTMPCVSSAQMTGGEGPRRLTADSFVAYVKEIRSASGSEDAFLLLTRVTALALKIRDTASARSLAMQLLDAAPTFETNWNVGNAVHTGNLVLGSTGLMAGDKEAAKRFLVAAGRARGSPQLMSFGPNMALARDLLQVGETATVLEYLMLCGRFWRMGRERLDQWKNTILAGGIPDFGLNLGYGLEP